MDESDDGHATAMAYLFLKAMPSAQVFIARVMTGKADLSRKDPNTPERVHQVRQ